MQITGGKYNGRRLKSPSPNISRPTLSKIRMAVFNVLRNLIEFEGKSFLDMYSGSGIMALEAASRGFDEVTVIDKNSDAIKIITSNFQCLQADGKIILGDSLRTVSNLNKHFNVVYIDPPYFGGIYEKSLEAVKSSDIIIVEHPDSVNLIGFEILKQKFYGGKNITFLKGSD